jgi:hypothetical protein
MVSRIRICAPILIMLYIREDSKPYRQAATKIVFLQFCELDCPEEVSRPVPPDKPQIVGRRER